MAKKRKRNRQRRQKQRSGQTKRPMMLGINLRNGAVTCNGAKASMMMQMRYMRLHQLIPEDIQSWNEAQLRQLLEVARVSGKEPDWERALVLLAHHESELACDLLQQVKIHAPPQLSELWELAYGESLGWLGYDYIPDEQGRPRAAPTGTPWPVGEPN